MPAQHRPKGHSKLACRVHAGDRRGDHDAPASLLYGTDKQRYTITNHRCCSHVFTSRAAWLAHRKQVNLTILVDGDPRLLNQYDVVLSSHTAKFSEAAGFINWLTSDAGQAAIASYR